MANKDFKKMVELGLWLEKYLHPEIRPWEYKTLANEFLDLYNVEFDLSPDDITLQLFQFLYEQPPEKKDSYVEKMLEVGSLADCAIEIIRTHTHFETNSKFEKLCSGQSIEIKNILNLIKDKVIYTVPGDFEIEFLDEWIKHSYKVFAHALLIQLIANEAFHKICIDPKPWYNSINDAFEKERFYLSNKNKSRLLSGYNDLVVNLRINENGAKKVKVFNDKYHHSFSDPGHPSCFPWNVAVSLIFFDFLFLGGQEYFMFCEQCGRFTAIQRKGRKKFCSDICRTAHKNARLTKSQQSVNSKIS